MADKVLVVGALIVISSMLNPWLWIVSAFIVYREWYVTIKLRSKAKAKIFSAVWSGKIKAAMQVMMIIAWLLPDEIAGLISSPSSLRMVVTVGAIVATAYSLIDYIAKFSRLAVTNPGQ